MRKYILQIAAVGVCTMLCFAGAINRTSGQFNGGSGGVSQSQLNAVVSTIPTPMGSIPPQPSGLGVIGSANQFFPSDGAQRQTVQRTTTTTDGSGNWTVTFNPGFVSATPTVNPIPINAGTQPMVCNVKTRSQTTQTGFCWLSNTISISLGVQPLVANGFNTGANGASVMIVAAEPTQ